jgi:type IV secretory pathway VirB10-like protein
MLQSRYERTRYIALLNSLICFSAARIQSVFRGHIARTFVSPRFRRSNHESPPSPEVSNPAASSHEIPAHQDPPAQPSKLKSASPPASPPPEKGVVEVSEQACLSQVQVDAPRVKAKACMPVWLLQVGDNGYSGHTIVVMMT